MKYNELIHFEPIESVVQLCEASDKSYAFNLLDTYVISERMADIIDEVVIEQLQFNKVSDNKGLLVVGNYGTGKSHLMSVLATIAETEGVSDRLRNERVAKRAKEIEGMFKVVRSEIGATTMTFRDFICGELKDGLEDMGIKFDFPTMNEVGNNKDTFVAMMGKFNEVYPDKGLLMVVDELLDYLRTRNGQDLILDLGFLRELGEICRITRFRFMAGVQEMLFDNPTFQFVAEQLRRVKERFEQVSIVREDIAYVVSQRLLKKDDKQKAIIREHLQKFTPLYDKLGERMEEFVSLFPVHPAYLATFEKVIVAEKRVILKTISTEMKRLMEQEVPDDQPGVISYDTYWQYIENDTSLKSNPDIREVLSKSKILQDRVQNAFTKPVYKPIALRIVRALSVNRLTTGDIYAQLGVTAEELRDNLFLYTAIPELEAEFLRSTIETTLKEILKTVSWQYISFNEANGQYYLDIKKDIAVDDLIAQKAGTLNDGQLDRYYFEVFEQLTDRAKNTYYRTGYKIWSYELPWFDCKVTRQGYLFFGAPNDRSTAQPPRDFYIYLLQAFDVPKYKDEMRSDEVFFKLKTKEESFVEHVRLYTASREMALTAASGTKALYEQKALEFLKEITKWLRNNFLNAFEVIYKGNSKKKAEWTKGLPGQAGVKEIIDHVATSCLASCFEEKYPEHPHFSSLKIPLTQENMPGYIQAALKYLCGSKTQPGAAILDGFVMLDGETLDVDRSGYAKWITELLSEKGAGHVINRNEIVETVYTVQGTEDVELTRQFKITPDLFSVVLAALVYNGNIVLTINGTQYDAMKMDELAKLTPREIAAFSHLKRPSGLPLAELKTLFSLLDIPQGLLQEQALSAGIAHLREKVDQLLTDTVTTMQSVKVGIQYWDGAVLTTTEQQQYTEKLTSLKSFLEALLVFNAPAKLHNFRYTAEEIQEQKNGLEILQVVKKLQQKVAEMTPLAQYLTNAGQHLPFDHTWQEESQLALEALLDALKGTNGYQEELERIKAVKHQYQDIYMEYHAKARLNAADDNRKNQLLNDKRFGALKQLATIEILPKSHFDALAKGLTDLQTCWSLTKEELETQPICPHCKFRPKDEMMGKFYSLSTYEDQMQKLLDDWTGLLLNNFNDPEVQDNITLLEQEQQVLINGFIQKKVLLLPLNPSLLSAIKILLQGIEKIEIKWDELQNMMGNGSPMSVEDIRLRFETLLNKKVGTQQTSRVRIMLEHRVGGQR